MPLDDLKKFLPQETAPDSRDELTALFDRANSTESTIRILNDELGCNVPENSRGASTKIWCPYSIEHDDPHDKNCRYYYESDHGYCFAVHGVLDAVFLRSMMWGVSRSSAANTMLEKAGLGSGLSWKDRIAESRTQLERQVTVSADYTNAFAALTTALRAVPEYVQHQYDDAARAVLTRAQEKFDPHWDMDHILKWIEETTDEMVLTLRR